MTQRKEPSIDYDDVVDKDVTLDVKDKDDRNNKSSKLDASNNVTVKDGKKVAKKPVKKKTPVKKKVGDWPVFGPVGNLVKATNPDKKEVIDLTCRLHKLTGAILVLCTILSTTKQFFGENIYCMLWAEEADVDIGMFESYCFMKATFTLSPTEILEDVTDKHMKAHHGVYPGDHDEDPDNVFHNYYQWVCFVLFLQAMGFYAPYIAWKNTESGRLEKLLAEIECDPLTEVPLDQQVEGLAKYLASHPGTFNNYAIKFFIYGLANLVNVIGQMYFMHLFLGGQFLEYGFSLLSNQSELDLTMERVFPKVTKCTMNLFGASGKVVKEAGICTLPQNILNEKLYLFFWIWFGILALGTFLYNIQKLLIMSCSCYRKALLIHSSNSVPLITVQRILKHSSYGDFILLMFIQNNVEPPQFSALLNSLGDELRSHYPPGDDNGLDDGTSPSPLHFHPYVDKLTTHVDKMTTYVDKKTTYVDKLTTYGRPAPEIERTCPEIVEAPAEFNPRKLDATDKPYGCLDGNMKVMPLG